MHAIAVSASKAAASSEDVDKLSAQRWTFQPRDATAACEMKTNVVVRRHTATGATLLTAAQPHI